MATATDQHRAVPDRFRGVTGVLYRGILAAVLAALAYLVVVVGYLAATPAVLHDPTRLGYPFAWSTLSGAALGAVAMQCRVRAISARSAVLGGSYVCLLSWISGQLSIGRTGISIDVTAGVPGWAPVLAADLGVVALVIVPFQFLGYLVLGLLFARALSVTTNSVAAGVLGVFTCAGCVLPIVAVVAAGSVPVLSGGLSYAVSTLAFAGTLAALIGIIAHGTALDSRPSPNR